MKLSTQKAQNTIEYLLMITTIILVLLAVLSPFGKMTKMVNDSIEVATQGIECMADNTCYGPSCPKKYAQCRIGAPILP